MANFAELKKEVTQIETGQTLTESKTFSGSIVNAPQGIEDQKRDGYENRPVVKGDEIKVLSGDKVQGDQKKEDGVEEYNLYKSYLRDLRKAGFNIPEGDPDRDVLVNLRGTRQHIITKEDGKQDIDWKEDVSPEVRQKFDWVIRYKIRQDKSMDEALAPEAKLAIPDYKLSIKGLEKGYEHQETNNCFCCAGAAMINQFLKTKFGQEGNFNQYSVRSFTSEFKKFDPNDPYFNTFSDEADYEQHIRMVKRYAGEGKKETGNIYEMGDFFLKNIPGGEVCLNRMNFQAPRENEENDIQTVERKRNNIKAVFLEQVHSVLSSGNVVSLLETSYKNYGHYLTITGIDGDKIEYLDSLGDTPEKMKRTKTVDELFRRLFNGTGAVELSWLSELKTPEELTQEYGNLNYDKEAGYSLKEPTADNAENPMHTLGIDVRKRVGDPGFLSDISLVTYIPNPLNKTATRPFDDEEGQKGAGEQTKKKTKQELKKTQKLENKTEDKVADNREELKTEKEKETEKKEKVKRENTEEIRKELPEETIDESKLSKKERKKLQKKRERREALSRLKQFLNDGVDSGRVDEKEARKQWKKAIIDYEKKHGDYETYGVGFSLDKTEINAADSEYMQNLKFFLKRYLEVRKEIFDKHQIEDLSLEEMREKNRNGEDQFHKKQGNNLIQKGRQRGYEILNERERDRLADVYESLQKSISDYRLQNNRFFKSGRGAARLRQVRLIQEKINTDNRVFWLSSERRSLINSLDAKYSAGHGDGFLDVSRMNAMPTWMKVVIAGDKISNNNQVYRDRRRRQKAEGEFPNVFARMAGWTWTGIKNTGWRTVMLLEGLGGLVDRGLGLATMLAANSLVLAGKVIKAPIKLLSACFNGISKHIFHSRKRWKVDYSLTQGWTSLDEGRQIFRRLLKGACVIPAAVVEGIYRGFPKLFSSDVPESDFMLDVNKQGAFKRTRKWSGAILKDLKNLAVRIGKGLGIKDYGAADRADEDFKQAGGYRPVKMEDGRTEWVLEKGNVDEDEGDALDDVREEKKKQRFTATRNKGKEQYTEEEVINNIKNINRTLKSKDEKLSDEERAELVTVKGREISSLLLLQEKLTGDSEQMKTVKRKIAGLELEMSLERNQTIDADEVDRILGLYDEAMKVCDDYLKDKDPTFQTGETRFRLVRLNLYRLKREAADLRVAKELIERGYFDEDAGLYSFQTLLTQARVYGLMKGSGGLDQGEPVEREQADEKTIKNMGTEAQLIYQAVSGRELPSDLITRLKKSKNKTEKQLAETLPYIFANIRSSLNDFEEGKVAAKVFQVGTTFLTFAQDAFGRLTMSVGSVIVPLERGTGVLSDALALDIVKNEQVYGRKQADAIVREIYRNLDYRKDNTEKRQLLVDYLSRYTEYSANDFANFFTNDLAGMVNQVLRGRRIVIVKEGDELENWEFLGNKEVFYRESGSLLVNVSEARELLKSKTKEELADKVKVQKRESAPAENAQIQQDKEELAWTPEEEQVKNLLSDLIFSQDSWIADDHVDDAPGMRMKRAIMKNAGALSVIVSQLFTLDKKDWSKTIRGYVDKMPLFMLDKEQNDKFKNTLTDSLVKVSVFLLLEMDKVVQERLRDIRSQIKAKQAEIGKKSEELKSAEGWDLIKIPGQIAGMTAELAGLTLLDDEQKIAEAVLRHLQSPQSLLNGNADFGVPSIAELIEEKLTAKSQQNIEEAEQAEGGQTEEDELTKDPMKTLADAEKAIDSGVEKAAEKIQETVKEYSGELFKPQKREYKPLPDPDEEGLDEAERLKRKRERIKLGSERLNQMVEDAYTGGESGQGLFTKIVFENYFTGISAIDKRSMVASMLRNAKPVESQEKYEEDKKKLSDEKEQIENEISKIVEEIGKEKDEEKKKQAEQRLEDAKARLQETEKRTDLFEKNREEIKTRAMANYLGGLLKGAGPLFQKMMQGLPLQGIPEELKGAVEDMKSKLAPIPEEIVKAEMAGIVDRSHGQIKSIEIVKSLGAASVGQTFLCRMTKQDNKVEEVAIKLLKPDVRNRMMRERELMIECARKTDIESREKDNEIRRQNQQPTLPEFKSNEKGGVQSTYEGQLARIEEELDLTVEARNMELGKVYDKGQTQTERAVGAAKLSSLVAPTMTSMVQEKAPGETLDSLLKRINDETRRLKDIYKKRIDPNLPEEERRKMEASIAKDPYYDSSRAVMKARGITEFCDECREITPPVIQEKLVALLVEMKKKKKFLEEYANEWVTEGIFKEGFYHGDPHDGNIMVSDEKLTVIDFGNCTKLSEDQQTQVTRMLAAASIADVETFRNGFHKLLKPEFEALYQEKRAELTRKFADIFALGDRKAAGARIAVALLEAQKLGLEIPAAVYNFSQGQMRLQNAIDNMNKQIKDTEDVVRFFSKIMESQNFDFSDDHMAEKCGSVDDGISLYQAANEYTTALLYDTDDKEDILSLTMDHTDTVERVVAYMVKQGEKLDDLGNKFIRQAASVPPEQRPGLMLALPSTFATMDCILGGEDRIRLEDDHYEMLTTPERFEEIGKKITAFIEEKKTKLAQLQESFNAMKQRATEIARAHKNKWEPTEEEAASIKELGDRFVDAFFPFQTNRFWQIEGRMALNALLMPLKNEKTGEYEESEEMEKQMHAFFKEHPEGEAGFRQVYNAYWDKYKEELKKAQKKIDEERAEEEKAPLEEEAREEREEEERSRKETEELIKKQKEREEERLKRVSQGGESAEEMAADFFGEVERPELEKRELEELKKEQDRRQTMMKREHERIRNERENNRKRRMQMRLNRVMLPEREALRKIYRATIVNELRKKEKLYSEGAMRGDVDFFDVMGDVISKHRNAVGSRMGYIKAYFFARKVMAQEAEEERDEEALAKLKEQAQE